MLSLTLWRERFNWLILARMSHKYPSFARHRSLQNSAAFGLACSERKENTPFPKGKKVTQGDSNRKPSYFTVKKETSVFSIHLWTEFSKHPRILRFRLDKVNDWCAIIYHVIKQPSFLCSHILSMNVAMSSLQMWCVLFQQSNSSITNAYHCCSTISCDTWTPAQI